MGRSAGRGGGDGENSFGEAWTSSTSAPRDPEPPLFYYLHVYKICKLLEMHRDCAKRRLTLKTGSPQQTSRREDHHTVRNARVQPIASSAAIQAQVAPSLGAPVSSRNIRRHLAEGYLGSRRPLRVLPLTSTHQRLRLEWCCARRNWTAAE
ncbi:transposable element Tcb2 transposase [Trichonephila clavipes]|nr:transposable element Tcb2 transposase [Trichonephila clavipes]